MTPFAAIEALAVERHGEAAVAARLLTPKTPEALRAVPDDRWLSQATKCIFQSGFNWELIEQKWPHFEEVFEGFALARWTMMTDDDVHELLKMKGIVANGAKIASVGGNARYFARLAQEAGTVGAHFARWRPEDYCANIEELRKNGARLGGMTGQMFLRRMGLDALIFSQDVTRALIREGIVTKAPGSGKDLAAVQAALDRWRAESGRGLTQISQILALSVG